MLPLAILMRKMDGGVGGGKQVKSQELITSKGWKHLEVLAFYGYDTFMNRKNGLVIHREEVFNC